jgi:tetratricopeptide (TPR) repeat protein
MTQLSEGMSLGSRFRLVSLLGSGGMGEVWLAVDETDNKQVALKVLNADLAKKQGFVELLQAEFDKARRLHHPNIVRVYASHHEGDAYFISMEYIEGRSLNEFRGQPWRSILKVVLPLTDTLAYAHKAGVVHRDIKPANILLDKAGSPRLTDFGVASVLSDDAAGQVRTGGSLPAMSPQQVAGEQPAVSDDIYSFGSLLYDLISGAPLFSPDVTAEKVSHETPLLLSEMQSAAAIPPQLDRLVAAMLEKDPGRRPAGMAAVKAALDEILADSVPPESEYAADDSGAIRPLSRRQSATAKVSPGYTPRPLASAVQGSSPGKMLYIGLGILAAALLAVIFLLPGIVAENRRSRPPQDAVPESVVAADPGAEEIGEGIVEQGSRELADNALADLLEIDDRLRGLGVEVWGGADWATARQIVTEGDEAYKDRQYGTATDAYRKGLLLQQPLEARAGEVLATALADAQIAVLDGNQLLALERFDLALLIDKGNAEASAGRVRAMRLDEVLSLMNQASQFEALEDFSEAVKTYGAALAIDPQWIPAQEGRARVSAAIAGNDYQVAMSDGYAALSAKNYSAARRSFAAALRAQPGDAAAQAALAQLDSEERLARIVALGGEAESLQAQELWSEAADRYSSILQVDSTVLAASKGLQESRARMQLDERLRNAIATPDRLGDDAIWQATQALLVYAQTVSPAGPVLVGQIGELDQLLQRARVPVAVIFESDSLTEVVIYKVGKLGAFATRRIELKPGVYTAVGVRSGYRDVRKNFRVAPEAGTLSVTIRCEDPI